MTNDMKKNNGTSRRDILKTIAAGAAGGSVAVLQAISRAASTVEGRRARYGMLLDLRKCVGCQACSIACKAEFDVPLGATRSWVEYIEKGTYPNVGRSFLPRLCNHCDDPPCVSVCPTGATYKRDQDGVVVVDTGLCIGCKYCVQACPYDARFLNPVTKVVDKCDFCIHRISKGLVPSCVNTCPAGARIFGDLNDPKSEISRMIAKSSISVLRPDMGTLPNVYYINADHTDPHASAGAAQGAVRVITHRRTQHRR